MYQIDNPTASSTLPAPTSPGTAGYFTDGNPATGVAPTIVPAEFLNMLMMELANLVSAAGLTPSKADRTQVSAAVKALAQSYQAGIVGQSRNAKMAIPAASASATYTADELIVASALGGLRYCLPSLNQTINLAADMDTGSAPANGTVAVYMMYNPTANTKKLLGFNATSVTPGQVYSGSNAPAGYTASALVAILQTNSLGQFKAAYVSGRRVSHASLSVLNTASAAASGTALDISPVVPKGANSVSGYIVTSNSTNGDSTNTVAIGVDSVMNGAKTFQPRLTSANGWSMAFSFENLALSVSQTLFYATTASVGSPNYQIAISGYEF